MSSQLASMLKAATTCPDGSRRAGMIGWSFPVLPIFCQGGIFVNPFDVRIYAIRRRQARRVYEVRPVIKPPRPASPRRSANPIRKPPQAAHSG
jgi:hypothetical protein